MSQNNTSLSEQMFLNTSRRGFFGDNAEEMDYCIGEVLDHLVSLGIDKDTLVFFTRQVSISQKTSSLFVYLVITDRGFKRMLAAARPVFYAAENFRRGMAASW